MQEPTKTNLFHLSVELHNYLMQFLSPEDFYHLRIAFPNYYGCGFSSMFIMKHLMRNGSENYKKQVFNYFIEKSNFKEQKNMVNLGFCSTSLIEKAIKNAVIKKRDVKNHVFFLLDNSHVDISFDLNCILCWAIKKNDFYFVRDILEREPVDIRLANYRVLNWAVRFYQPTTMLGDIILTLIPFRFDHQTDFLARQACIHDKYMYFRDYPHLVRKNAILFIELLQLCITNHAQLSYVQLLQEFHGRLEYSNSRYEDVETLFTTAIRADNFDAFAYLFGYLNDCVHFHDDRLLKMHRKLLTVAVVANNVELFDYLIRDFEITFDNEEEKVFVYFFSINQGHRAILEILLELVPPTTLRYGSWLLFYMVRDCKNKEFKELVSRGLVPSTLPTCLISKSTLQDFEVHHRSLYETNDYPPTFRYFTLDATSPKVCDGPMTHIKETNESFLVFNTSYIYSKSLDRHFISYSGEIRQPEAETWVGERQLIKRYAMNCRKLHCFLQGLENTTQNVIWGHFLTWLENEAERPCGHYDCVVGVEKECLYQRTFNMNYPHGITNVNGVEQEFYHL